MQNTADGEINKHGLSNPYLMVATWWKHFQNYPGLLKKSTPNNTDFVIM